MNKKKNKVLGFVLVSALICGSLLPATTAKASVPYQPNELQKVAAIPLDSSLSVNAYNFGDVHFKGTNGANIKTVVLFVNGKERNAVAVKDGGLFEIYAKPWILSPSDKIEIAGRDENGLEVARKAAAIRAENMDYALQADTFSYGDQTLTGTYGSDLDRVRLAVNGKVVGQAAVEDGVFTLANISSFVSSVNDQVELIGVDKGFFEQARITVEFANKLTADPFTYGDTHFVGKHGVNVEKVALFVNGKEKNEVKVKVGGNYILYVDPWILSPNDKAEVVGRDASGTEIIRIEVPIQAGDMDYALVADSYAFGDTALTGTYGKDLARVRLSVNDKVVAQAVVENGIFTFANAGAFISSVNDKVEIIGADKGYFEQARTTVEFSNKLSIDPFTFGDTHLIGKHGSSIEKVALFVNGKEKNEVKVKDGGNYILYSDPWILSPSDKVEIVGRDATGTEVAREVVKVQAGDMDYTLTAEAYNFGTQELTGTYGEDLARVRLAVNGKVVAQATVANGAFTFANAGSYIVSQNDKVEVIGIDKGFYEQARITIDFANKMTIDPFTFGDLHVTGMHGKSIEKVAVLVNGKEKNEVAVKDGGSYKIYVDPWVLSANDKVEIVGRDASGKEVTRQTVTIDPGKVDYTLNINPYALGAKELTGTYGQDVARVRLAVNGKVIAQALTDNGSFTFANANLSIISFNDKVEVIGVDKGFHEQTRETVKFANQLTVDSYTFGDVYFTGTHGESIEKVALFVNGKERNEVAVKSGGVVKIYVEPWVLSANDKLELVGRDASGAEIARQAVAIQPGDQDYSLTTNDYALTDSELSGTYGKDIAKVRLSVNGKVVAQASMEDGSYQFATISQFVKSPSDKVEVIGVDRGYFEQVRVAVTLK
ncbi:hypothetical protein MFLO_14302 [Listeria floridensis FSL S10-1187]|uniref:Bacterial Ig domain-containing protein n=1 Tax=Listeria floridensis FSL S10-1187 TaxID=1265817 RepID=A0ABN0RC06_9LIST|nr:immunoglobulin-like domain-containing protein [Listeria floridensis]EUJ26133.1 hypothetical protein MFLO_14302 [Listeria floridensis FSL S10-1187]